MRGTLTIKNDNGHGTTLMYHGEVAKKQIIERWKKLYGKAFLNAEIIDKPEEPPVKESSQFKKGSVVPKTNINRRNYRSKINNEN